MNEMTKIENLDFSYSSQSQRALHGIDLAIEKGSVVGITGPAGAGKSTLLSVVNGVIPHYTKGKLKGRVLVKGQEVSALDFGKLARVVGTVFQDVDFQTVSITVEEEVAFGPENIGLAPREIETRIEDALSHTGISPLRNRTISTLSGGQKQRVAIASVLSMLPEVLLLDEPTSELDPIGTEEVFDAIFKLNRECNMTIVIVSQKVEKLVDCDRILVMSRGKIISDGPPKKVFLQDKKLSDIGVAVPQITAFMIALCKKIGRPLSPNELPLTIDEAEKCLKDVLQDNGGII